MVGKDLEGSGGKDTKELMRGKGRGGWRGEEKGSNSLDFYTNSV